MLSFTEYVIYFLVFYIAGRRLLYELLSELKMMALVTSDQICISESWLQSRDGDFLADHTVVW